MSQHPPAINQIETVARSIFPSTPLTIERVAEGVSTWVYRTISMSETIYLRVLPEEDASFAPEVEAHTLLRHRRVNVPEVIYFEHHNDLLQRSIMVTRAIKGQPLNHSSTLSEEAREAIVAEAGRDLALINSVPVEGFGWVQQTSPEMKNRRCDDRHTSCFSLKQSNKHYACNNRLSTVGRMPPFW